MYVYVTGERQRVGKITQIGDDARTQRTFTFQRLLFIWWRQHNIVVKLYMGMQLTIEVICQSINNFGVARIFVYLNTRSLFCVSCTNVVIKYLWDGFTMCKVLIKIYVLLIQKRLRFYHINIEYRKGSVVARAVYQYFKYFINLYYY